MLKKIYVTTLTLAIPIILAPFDNVLLRNLGYRSVVIISLAASNAVSLCNVSIAFGTTSSASSFAGNRHPITPVLEGSTLSTPPGNFNKSATAWHTNSAFPTPSPPEQTLDILLLITIVWIGLPDDSRERPTLIGAPGNYNMSFSWYEYKQ